jgi:acylphosphatase
MKAIKRFYIKNTDSDVEILRCSTHEKAEEMIKKFESEDSNDGIYIKNYYVIVDTEKK